ncbi:MAG: TolC family protein [Lentisphaerae bacterium]|nr:TolC family protein [Lentisphaerota bacterium]
MGLALWIGCLASAGAEREVRELTLADCVGLALENNLDLRIEKLTRRIAGREREAARGGYDPAFTLSAKRTREETEGASAGTASGALELAESKTDGETWNASIGGATGLGGLRYEAGARLGESSGTRQGNPFDTSTGSASVTLTQPLLRGFRADETRYRVTLADRQSAEAEVQMEGRLQEVLGEVEAAWYALLQAREAIRVQEEAVRLATRLYEDNRRKVQIGSMSALDEKQAESQAASARADLSSARRAYAEAQNRIRTLVYADHRSLRHVDLVALGDLPADPADVDAGDSGMRALENRPDLRQARMALERQGVTVAYQRNQTLPSLDLVGGYGVAASDETGYGDAFDRMGSADEPFWSVGVTLSVPLGNRAARARHLQSQDSAGKMALQLRQAEESALVEVDNTVAAVLTGFERVQATREAREYAEQALEAEQRKLDSGKSTSFVVLQLQRDVTSARNSEISALADYNRQRAALALAEGAMLERHGVEWGGE